MENCRKRGQQEEEEIEHLPAKLAKLEEESTEKQPKLVEENQEEGDQEPDEEFLEPHLACEIYAMLPAVHQRRLLILCRDIWELGPSTDEWVKWKIFQWCGNRWDPRVSEHVQISEDGLNLNKALNGHDRAPGFVRAIRAAEFMPTQLEGPQFCYFEAKHIRGHFFFGFDAPGNQKLYLIDHDGIYMGGGDGHYLPNVAPILDKEVAILGCGLMKHLGKKKIFFTKNGQLIAKPIPLPSSTPNEMFPLIIMASSSADCQFEDTNFGLRPFQFKYKGNEAKLAEEMAFD